MRILFLTQWFYPEPSFKGLPFAKKLKAQGHKVEVLTGFPNYPGGKVYPGYKVRLYQREVIDGIRVNRVALFPSHDRSGFKRIMNYLSFLLSTLCSGPFVVNKPDVVYVYNLITLSITALLLKKITGCKVVYDVQDLWPESVSNSGMLPNALLVKLLMKWCVWAYRSADKIAVQSPGFRRALMERGVPEERIEVIYNWCDESSRDKASGENLTEQRRLSHTFNIVYAGNMGIMQGLDTVLDTARLCRHEMPDLRFVLVGDGVELERLKTSVDSQGLDNVVFIPKQPRHGMDKVWAIADVLLVHLVDAPLFRITIPSKTQAYMAVGLPIVMAVRGDAASLVSEAGAGITCMPQNPMEMKASIKKIYGLTSKERELMGERGKQFYDRFLSFDNGCKNFIDLFQRLLPG